PLGLVVARQVGKLESPTDERPEELLAADGAADDEVTRLDVPLAQARCGLDELAEALGRIDEAEEGHHRNLGREAEGELRPPGVARPEPLQVDRVRNDRRADAEDARDVLVDGNGGR